MWSAWSGSRAGSRLIVGQSIGNVRLAITESPLVAELVNLGNRIDAVMCSYKLGTEIPLSELRCRLLPLKERKGAIVRILNQKAGRNDPCPCQSGLKYKKCCGRDNRHIVVC